MCSDTGKPWCHGGSLSGTFLSGDQQVQSDPSQEVYVRREMQLLKLSPYPDLALREGSCKFWQGMRKASPLISWGALTQENQGVSFRSWATPAENPSQPSTAFGPYLSGQLQPRRTARS